VDRIPVYRQFIIAVEDGDGIRIHPSCKSFPVGRENPVVKWQIFHAGKILRIPVSKIKTNIR
jgi:hypothetical protein